MQKRVVLYSRISVSTDESVSISRQEEAGRHMAKAKGWTVVGEFRDEGVSASATRPEERAGWRALLEHEAEYSAVIIWKVDRLARRTLDFLHANEALEKRGAGIVAVGDPIDMTTKQGQAFATMLAVFGELEAAAISARVRAARTHLVKSGRVVGGSVPYGWLSVPNPNGPGKVLAHDPERINWVRGMAERALAGDTIYAIAQWLTREKAPLPRATQARRKHEAFNYISVERLLRSPVLAGMTPFNPGRGRNDRADPTAVLRDEDGLPVIDHSLAILSLSQHRQLLTTLDSRDSPQSMPRASKGSTSLLLSRLVTCAHCDRTMHRGSQSGGRETLRCPVCLQTLTTGQFKTYLVDRLLAERGDHYGLEQDEQPIDVSAELAAVESAIRDLSLKFGDDNVDTVALLHQVEALKERRGRLRSTRPPTEPRFRRMGPTVRVRWEATTSDEERREILVEQTESVRVRRGKRGGRFLDVGRIEVRWREDPLR